MAGLMLALIGCKEDAQSMNLVEIYYVPIGSETYVPVTTSNIEELAVKKGSIDLGNKKNRRFLSLIEKAKPGQFDDGYIRVKLVLSGEKVIYVDNNGGVLVESITKVLDRRSLKEVKKIIESQLE